MGKLIFIFWLMPLACVTAKQDRKEIEIKSTYCPEPIYKGFSDNLSDLDEFYIDSGNEGCKARYPSSPCLKKLEKTGPNDYKFTCTRPKSKSI